MLILVRHGRTAPNAAGLVLGRADPALDEVGERQAAALAAAVAAPARVVTSPLRRAVATAEVFGVPVAVDDRWIELDYGEYDLVPVGEAPVELWQRWRADPGWAPPGGESLASLGARVRAACDELAAEAAERDVVVVSHVSPIKAAVAWALGTDDRVAVHLHLGVAAICRVRTSGGRPVLTAFNERHHLPVER